MNIFILDKDPVLAAQYHCDKHVVKMITESCQILSTALLIHPTIKLSDALIDKLYKPTHSNHPCVKWCLEKTHFKWVNNLLGALLDEYNYRFEKPDNFVKARELHYLFNNIVKLWETGNGKLGMGDKAWDMWPQCMPDMYKNRDIVEAYRAYYKYGKTHLHKWAKREKPTWAIITESPIISQ